MKKFSKKFSWSLVDFPGGSVIKNLPANAGDADVTPGPVV